MTNIKYLQTTRQYFPSFYFFSVFRCT